MRYTFKRLSKTIFIDIIPIFKSAFSQNRIDDNLENKFDTDFAGNSNVGFIAYSEKGEPSGYYGVFPTDLIINGKRTTAAQSGNTMVHKNHQGKGLFISLANETYQLCRELGIKVVFGFPSSTSYPGFVKKLSWVHNENIQKYNFIIPTIPLSELAHKFFFIKPLFNAWKHFILLFYKKGSFFRGTILDQKLDGVNRDVDFWKYKFKNNAIQCFLFSNTNVIIKFDGKLGVGDIDFKDSNEFKKVLNSLKLFCFIAGINRLSFYVSPNTPIDIELSKFQKAKEGLAIGYVSFDGIIDPKNVKFSYFDFDTF
jgi:GNAT superfamily N-acetyltransferase